MKKTVLLILIALTTMMSYAESFVRDLVTYTIISKEEKTIEVTTYEIDLFETNLDAVIPSTVNFFGDDYQVVTIGSNAFQGLKKIRSVSLPNTVKTIGGSAFSGCTGLTQIKLSEELGEIPSFAFYGCNSLKEILLPDGIQMIGYYAFGGCSELSAINLPDSIAEILDGAFSGCCSLKSISLPNKLTIINRETFSGCTNLEKADIPDGITIIDTFAFKDCASLTAISFPDGLEYLATQCFSGCKSFTEIAIPRSVNKMEGYVFQFCSNLTTVHYNAINSDCTSDCFPSSLSTVYVGEEVERIPIVLFLLYPNLTTVYFNAKHNTSCQFSQALTEIIISKEVEFIPEHFVSGSERLTSITLPASVDSIGNYAFEGCLGLREIHCQNPLPPVVAEEGVFYAIEDCTLYVPTGSASLYAEAPGWNGFSNIVEEETQAITSIIEDTAIHPDTYSIDGRKISYDIPGIHIVAGKKILKTIGER